MEVIGSDTSSVHSIYKAVYCLTHLAEKWSVVKRIYSKDIVGKLRKLLDKDEPQLVRAVCRMIVCLLKKPENLRLWLKFDSRSHLVNSS